MLCSKCKIEFPIDNVSIGKMKESPDLIRKLALYIERK